MADFRFENLEVWKVATEIGHRIADLADSITTEQDSPYSEQLRRCSWRISGILAEGSSCATKLDFSEFVGRARAATMEIANLVIFFGERQLVSEKDEDGLIGLLKREAKMLENFRQSLERAERPATAVVA